MKLLFTIVPFILFFQNGSSQNIATNISNEGVLFTENSDTILFYQTSQQSLRGKYKRSNYIHPLYTIGGQVITEDFPDDHPHQRGIFWAWHQLYIDSLQIGDGWECRDIEWLVNNIQEIKTDGLEKCIRAEISWQSPLWTDSSGIPKTIVNEQCQITVFPTLNGHRLVDIEIQLLAMNPNTSIGGSNNDKGYGGFSARIKLPDDISFHGTNGSVTPRDTPVKSEGWVSFEGTLNNEKFGVAILAHSNNPGFPNPWILRSKKSMQNAVFPYPGKIPIHLSEQNPTILRYRMIIYKELSTAIIDKLFEAYNSVN